MKPSGLHISLYIFKIFCQKCYKYKRFKGPHLGCDGECAAAAPYSAAAAVIDSNNAISS